MFLKIGESWVNPAQIAHLRLFEGKAPRLSVVTCDGAAHTIKGKEAGEVFKQLVSRTMHFVQTSACASGPITPSMLMPVEPDQLQDARFPHDKTEVTQVQPKPKKPRR